MTRRRNELVALDLVITIVAAALGLVAAIAGICGKFSKWKRVLVHNMIMTIQPVCASCLILVCFTACRNELAAPPCSRLTGKFFLSALL